jgi:hypothetical protein
MTSYSAILDCVRLTGIFNSVINESVGTGDAIVASFSLDNDNIVDDSETVYVSNVAKTQGVDYTINNSSGVITFLSVPAAGATITANYKYFSDNANISNDDITSMIQDADAEIDNWTGKTWTNANSQTDYFPGRAEKISVQGSRTYGQYHTETQDEQYVILLTKYPVQSVTSLQFLDDDGTVSDTLVENTDFHYWSSGKIQLIGNTIPVGLGKKKVKVVYTYGTTSVPRNVKTLSAALTGIMVLCGMTGGSFHDIKSFTLGPKTVAFEDTNITLSKCLEKLENIRDRILDELGRELRQTVV